jgi:hypothetical protein
MASDIVLVLRSEQRSLDLLAQRCSRRSRGLEDPFGDLRAGLLSHVEAVAQEVAPTLRGFGEQAEWLQAMRQHILAAADNDLPREASEVVEFERIELLPAVASLAVEHRRRLGKAFRIRREASQRARGQGRRRPAVSQTELYEQARRAGISQRSRMSHAELWEAVSGAQAHRSQ